MEDLPEPVLQREIEEPGPLIPPRRQRAPGLLALILLVLALGPPLEAAVPREDVLRQLGYRFGPAFLMTRPARGAAPRWDLPPPRETHRRTRIRVDGTRVVARIHQVFFNASYQDQQSLLLVPDPGPGGEVSVSFRAPAFSEALPRQSWNAAETREKILGWAVTGGNPSPLARVDGPTQAIGPFLFGRGGYVKVDWRYEFQLRTPPGSLHLLAMAPGARPVKPLALNALELDLPASFRSHTYSPTHRLLQRDGGPGRLVLNPVVERLPPSAPFLLLWPPDPGAPGLVRGHSPEGDLGLLLVPPGIRTDAPRPPRAWVIALDIGGSLLGAPFQEAVTRVEKILGLLEEGDLFELVPFSVYPQPFHRSPIPATPENIRQALDFLRARRPRGAVHIEAAILTCLEIASEAPPELERAVLLLTDGRPTLGEVHPRSILGQQGSLQIPVFPVASGPDTDYYFLEQLARLTGGASVFHEAEEDPIPLVRARVRPSREEEWGQILIDGQPLETPQEFRYDGPRVVTFPFQGEPQVRVRDRELSPAKAPDLGLVPHLVARARGLGGAIWDSLSGRGTFPGGALSFRLLGLVPGTPRPRILHTVRDGVGPLGRARMLALQGLLDQGTYQPVDPGPSRTWSGNRFFLQDSDHLWVESGLDLDEAQRIELGSVEHSRLTTLPNVVAHLGLDRSLALFTPSGPVWISPPEVEP